MIWMDDSCYIYEGQCIIVENLQNLDELGTLTCNNGIKLKDK